MMKGSSASVLRIDHARTGRAPIHPGPASGLLAFTLRLMRRPAPILTRPLTEEEISGEAVPSARRRASRFGSDEQSSTAMFHRSLETPSGAVDPLPAPNSAKS